MKGELASVLPCMNPHPEIPASAFAACALPEDSYPEAGDPSCPDCRTRVHCDKPGHGANYVGLPMHGFRTDRCPASWALSPYVWGIQEAHGWSVRPGAAFTAVYGQDLPAILVAGIAHYDNEVKAREGKIERDRLADLEKT